MQQLGMLKRLKAALVKHPARTASEPIMGSLVIDFGRDRQAAERARSNIAYDARLFLGNWCLAHNTLLLQENIAQARLGRAYALEGGGADI